MDQKRIDRVIAHFNAQREAQRRNQRRIMHWQKTPVAIGKVGTMTANQRERERESGFTSETKCKCSARDDADGR